MAAAQTSSSGAAPLTLVGHAAFRPFRNVWMLEELGVPYEHIAVRPHSQEAAKVNPFSKIPTLKDGDFTLYESAAINTYLGDKYRGSEGMPALVPPPGTQARGRYEQMVCFLMSEVDAQGLWIHRKHEALAKFFGAIPEAVAAAKAHTLRCLEVMTEELSQQGPYLLGADFSAADILLVHCLEWASMISWLTEADREGNLQGLFKYWDLCKQRAAYKVATQKKEAKL